MDGSRLPALGPRGEGWVVAQVLCFGLVFGVGATAPAWPDHLRPRLISLGTILIAAGAMLFAAGIRGLGRSLSPFPRPLPGAELRESGGYKLVRHPVYGALLLLAGGATALTSPWDIIPTILLGVILTAKSTREEHWLVEKYEGYASYRSRVRRRFIPFVL